MRQRDFVVLHCEGNEGFVRDFVTSRLPELHSGFTTKLCNLC